MTEPSWRVSIADLKAIMERHRTAYSYNVRQEDNEFKLDDNAE